MGTLRQFTFMKDHYLYMPECPIPLLGDLITKLSANVTYEPEQIDKVSPTPKGIAYKTYGRDTPAHESRSMGETEAGRVKTPALYLYKSDSVLGSKFLSGCRSL